MIIKNRKFYTGVAIISGCAIGAGILGISYPLSRAGFLTGILTLLLLVIVLVLTNLYLGETTLRTKGRHQLTGYAEIYLGKWGKRLMAFALIYGIYSALTAYIIGVGASLADIFPGSALSYRLFFVFIMALILYIGLRAVAESELFMGLGLIIILIAIILLSLKNIHMENLANLDISKFFIPYGALLFASMSFPAISEAREELMGKEKLMKKVIITGTLIPAVVYLIFSFVVVGSVSLSFFEGLAPNDRIANIALGKVIGSNVLILGNVFAIVAMTTSFLALGLGLKETLIYDHKMKNFTAWALTICIPLAIAIIGLGSFIEIISLSGVITGGLTATLVLLMITKAKKHGNRTPEYSIPINNWIILSLMLLFMFGAGYHFLTILNVL